MQDVLYLLVGWALGLVLCVVMVRAIVVRYRLPWRATLIYFGLLPHPEEALLSRPTGSRSRKRRSRR